MIIISIIVLIIIFGCYSIISLTINKSKNKTIVEFRESLEIAGIPITKFKVSGKELNFIIDSGSSMSCISSKTAELIKADVSASQMKSIIGVGGNTKPSSETVVVLEDVFSLYEITFQVNDALNKSFNRFEKSYGITVHGIIGNDFLSRYGFILNYNKMSMSYNR